MNRWIILILSFLFADLAIGQNFNDTISSLSVSIDSAVEKLQEKAKKLEKRAQPEKKRWLKELDKVRELGSMANSTVDAEEKKKLLIKILRTKKHAEHLQGEYIKAIEGAHGLYFEAIHAIYKKSPSPDDAEAMELAASLEDYALRKIKKGKSKRKKAERVGDDAIRSEALIEASEAEQAAISDLVYAIKLRHGVVAIVKQETYVAKAIMEESFDTMTAYNSTAVSIPKQDLPFQEISVIYKVQIAASKEELSPEKLMTIYDPKPGERIFSIIEDGWYKYSIGRFHTYTEAKAYKDETAVEGAFVIAYKDNKKIELPEIESTAMHTKSGNTTVQKSNGQEIIYRIQIAATRQPANLFRMKGMKLSGRSVNIIQKDGWYKYTIGYFETEQAAKDTMQTLNNPDAFVVRYTLKGEEVKIH